MPQVEKVISIKHVYEVHPRKDKRGVDLISDACHSVGCGMANRMLPVMLSAMLSITVAHMMP